MTTIILIGIALVLLLFLILMLVRHVDEENEKLWKAINKINEGSYLVKEKEGD